MRSAFFLGLAILVSASTVTRSVSAQVPEELPVEQALEREYPTIQQWVVLENGRFRGRLVTPGWEDAATPIVGARVMVTGEDNVPHYADGLTNTIGEFVVSDLEPGIYTLFAGNQKAVACQALHVVSAAEGSNLASEAITVSAAKLSQDRFLSAVSRYLTKSISRSIPLDVAHADQMASNYDPAAAYRVVQTDGGLSGRILSAPRSIGSPSMNVLVYRGGSMVAKTTTDEKGGFFVSDLPPASYGLVVMGQGGMAVIGIELLAEPSGLELTRTGSSRYFVRAQASFNLAIQLAPIAQNSPEIEELQQPGTNIPNSPALVGGGLPLAPAVPPITGGGVGGSFGGGGGSGGIGGGGGLGAVGLGAIGVGAAVAAADDDDDAIVPPAASPATP